MKQKMGIRTKRAGRSTEKTFKTMGQFVSYFFPSDRSRKRRLQGTGRQRGSKAADEVLVRLGKSISS